MGNFKDFVEGNDNVMVDFVSGTGNGGIYRRDETPLTAVEDAKKSGVVCPLTGV